MRTLFLICTLFWAGCSHICNHTDCVQRQHHLEQEVHDLTESNAELTEAVGSLWFGVMTLDGELKECQKREI